VRHRWLFVRHGESLANAEGWLAGQSDPALTALGVAQARALASTLDGHAITRVYTSDLVRARATGDELLGASGPPRQAAPELRERHLGAWEGHSRLLLRATGDWDRLLTWDGRPPGGESQDDVSRRMLAFLASIDHGGTTLIVSHGTALRSALGVLDDVPRDQIGRHLLRNAELTVRDIPMGTWAALARRGRERERAELDPVVDAG
jgi:broad specificity phosphatase PhoE